MNSVCKPFIVRRKRGCRKSAVHRSAIRSNASSKFLQNYAGKRVRQPRTPNTSAERKFTNLIKLKQYRVKRIVSPSTPTCWRQASSFRSRRNTISHGETQTQQTKERRKKQRKMMCSLCRSVLCQVMWHSSSCSLNELLTPVLRADVSTGKLDSRFPVNKPQVLQIKVCWNYSSCYKSTKLNFTRWIQKHRNTSKSSQIKLVLIQTWITSSLVTSWLTSQERSDSHKVSVQPSSEYKT